MLSMTDEAIWARWLAWEGDIGPFVRAEVAAAESRATAAESALAALQAARDAEEQGHALPRPAPAVEAVGVPILCGTCGMLKAHRWHDGKGKTRYDAASIRCADAFHDTPPFDDASNPGQSTSPLRAAGLEPAPSKPAVAGERPTRGGSLEAMALVDRGTGETVRLVRAKWPDGELVTVMWPDSIQPPEPAPPPANVEGLREAFAAAIDRYRLAPMGSEKQALAMLACHDAARALAAARKA